MAAKALKKHSAQVADADEYLTSTQVRERYGQRSEMWLSRILKDDPLFPRPIFVGRFRFWSIASLSKYEREVAAQRANPRTGTKLKEAV